MIDPYFEGYSPRLYRGLTITNEHDGYFRIYDGRDQLGWATRLREAKRLIDEWLARLNAWGAVKDIGDEK